MEDEKIVQLYWDRNEKAISASSKKYGAYCSSIAMNILNNLNDAEECVNDTYLRAWNTMPPHKPTILSTFLGKITRNLSFDVYRKQHTNKHGNGQIVLVLDELSEVVSGGSEPEKEIRRNELIQDINDFLATLPKEKRMLFVCRYWYADSVTNIARQFKISENNVSVNLNRVRKKLCYYLIERGYEI